MMKTLKINKNANWYTARFTDITVSEKRGVVVLENYFTKEHYLIEDIKFAKKISYYLYGYGYGRISKGIEVKDVADFSIWTNQRKFSAKYDNVENR